MSERTQEIRTTEQAATADGTKAPAQQQGAAAVQAMLARGRRDPAAIAGVMQSNPGANNEILTLLSQTLGSSFVRAVLDLVMPGAGPAVASAATGPTGPTGPMRVTAHGLHVRSSPSKSSDDNVVGMLPHHAIVEASGHHGEWVGIEHGGKPAFVFGQYVEPVARPVASAPAAPAIAHHTHHEPTTSVSTVPAPPASTAAPIDHPAVEHPAANHPDPAHVAAPAKVDAAHKDGAAPKDKPKKHAPPSGFTKYGGGTVKSVLTRLANSGKLKITGSQIAQLDAVAQVETGGQISGVDTTDDQVVSIGFHQVVLGHKSIEAVMLKAPAAFAKHGLSLDMSARYNFASKPHQIAGAPDYEELRGHDWGMKFYEASLDPDVIVAIAEFALAEATLVEGITKESGGTADLFNDDTARAWLLEVHNNRPSYTGPSVKKAVENGAKAAKDRDRFLDILGAAIVDTYGEMEPLTILHNEKAALPKGKHLTSDEEATLLEKLKAKYGPKGRTKGTHIITKMSRHLDIPKLDPAPAAAAPAAAPAPVANHPAAPVAEHHDAPAPVHHDAPAPVHHGAPAHHDAPAAPVHHDAPTAAPHPTAISKDVSQPAATPHVEPAKPVVTAPTTVHAPPSATNPNNHVDTSADVFSAVYQAGVEGHKQYTQVYVSPGGLTSDTPDVFLFFHGHVAQYNIDPTQKQKKVEYTNGTEMPTLISGKDVAADAMTHARGKNTVCILPQGVVGSNHGGSNEGGYMQAIVAGLPSFMASVLGQLAKDLKLDPARHLSPGHLSIAGHSAGGYEGVSSALSHAKDKTGDLYDTISDVTLMDSGYGDPLHFRQTRDWMFQGKPGKNVRIIAQGGQLDNKDQGYHQVFDRKALAAACTAHPGFSFEDLAWNDKPTKETRVMQHSRILKDGAPHAEVLVMKYWDPTGMTHHNLRDHVMDDAALSIGEGQSSGGKDFGNDTFGRRDHGVVKDVYEKDGAPHVEAPAAAKPASHTEGPKPTAHAETPAPTTHADKPKPVEHAEAKPAAHADAAKLAEHTAKPAPSGEVQATHVHKGYDSKNGIDSYGNATASTRESNKHVADANHRVFANTFTTIAKAYLYTGPTTEQHHKDLLAVGTTLHVLKVNEHRAQIVTPEITAEHNIWINFMNLGGKPTSAVPLGNELTDPQDKLRADAIRAGLPSVCKPGQSPHKWKFGDKFKPSWNGVALDASLMSKVVALMDWAIANDMVTGDIVIGEGMRDPRHAHYMSVRYWIAIENMHNIDESLFPTLKDGGRDDDGTKWWDKSWSREQIIENAKNEYKKNGGTGKVAAEGYNFGDHRRAPMRLGSGQGVSAHCSGHAVDVGIPWRSEKDPVHGTDLWGWEQIYHQFGLTRPLHRDHGGKDSMQEHWHVEETGKSLNLKYDEEKQP